MQLLSGDGQLPGRREISQNTGERWLIIKTAVEEMSGWVWDSHVLLLQTTGGRRGKGDDSQKYVRHLLW